MPLKNLGSKLANSVHQVKLKREQDATMASAKIASAAKPVAKPIPVSVAAKPVARRAAQPPAKNLDSLHPRRIWPD